MSFRPVSWDIWRGGLVLIVLLACSRSLRAEDTTSRSIEIVPIHGATINTNADPFRPADSQDLSSFPNAPHSLQDNQPLTAMPLPPPPRPQVATPSQREREMLDRRKNWVFMTPEDLSGQDEEKDITITREEQDVSGAKPGTAMQRYYQHLYDTDRAMATNQFSNVDSGNRNSTTNSLGTVSQNDGGTSFVTSPFNAVSENDAFRSARPTVFSDVFGSDTDSSTLSPEAVRLKAEQKSHMDDFKELWNIDQASTAPVSPSTPAMIGSSSAFGASQGQSFTPMGLPDNGFSRAQPTTTFQPAPPPPAARHPTATCGFRRAATALLRNRTLRNFHHSQRKTGTAVPTAKFVFGGTSTNPSDKASELSMCDA